jgi:hypothetical protein
MNSEIADATSNLVANNGIFGLSNIWEFVIRYAFNLLMVFIVIRVIYYPKHKNKDFLFTFFLFNTVNFLICFLLSTTQLKLGFAFGLFAIFSILRYRTVSVPIREMGYFFVCVTIGLLNSLADLTHAWEVLLLSNLILLALIFALENSPGLVHENYKEINYERIDLIKPDKREEMIQDLIERTGLPIHRVEINKIDFLKDVSRIKAYYLSNKNETDPIMQNDED